MRTNAFTFVGGLVGIIGVVLAIAGTFADGEARGGLMITGLSLVPFGAIFYTVGKKVGKWRGLRPDVIATGTAATATVTAMSETGVTVNNHPVLGYTLEVTTDRDPFTAQIKQMTPRMLVGAITPGSTVTVRYDPADTTDIALDFSVAPQQAAAPAADLASTIIARLADATPDERTDAAELLGTGRKGTARITSAQDVGRTIGDLGLAEPGEEEWDDSLFVFGLQVKIPGRSAYPVQVAHRIPDDLVGTVGPGAEVKVAVDRDQPEQHVAIDWEAFRGGRTA